MMPKNNESNPNIQKAVAFFTHAKLTRLLIKLREKYIELGQVGGQILLQESTPDERRNIATFLARGPYHSDTLRVRLVDIDRALRQSGFACTLPELLSAFFPDQPLVTRQEQRAVHAVHQADFRTALFSIETELLQGSRSHLWLLNGQHGQEWLYSRYKNASVEEQERQLKQVRYIAHVLDQLPDSPERLALFAQRTSGDPHTLDPDRVAGRLFLLALHDLSRESTSSLQADDLFPTSPQDREQELLLYANAGLLVDTIASHAAVFNLAGALLYPDDTFDPLLQAAGKRVLLLPMRQLLAWKSILAASTDSYVFENPQVFETVIAELDTHKPLPTLICTSGWPSVAAIRLLDLLVASDNHLHYSGDFDLKGLQIASHLMARYPEHCLPWRFDLDSYTLALQGDGIQARTNDVEMLNTLPTLFASLVAMIQEKKQWAYQEGITHLLVADIKGNNTQDRATPLADSADTDQTGLSDDLIL